MLNPLLYFRILHFKALKSLLIGIIPSLMVCDDNPVMKGKLFVFVDKHIVLFYGFWFPSSLEGVVYQLWFHIKSANFDWLTGCLSVHIFTLQRGMCNGM